MFTRGRWEQELRGLAFRDFDQIAHGRRTFTVREIAEMPESMQRCIKSINVRHVTQDAGDGTTDHVVEVKLWSKTRAQKLAARAGTLKDRMDVTTSEETLARLDEWRVANRLERERQLAGSR